MSLLDRVREHAVTCPWCLRKTWMLDGICRSRRCRERDAKSSAAGAPASAARQPATAGEYGPSVAGAFFGPGVSEASVAPKAPGPGPRSIP